MTAAQSKFVADLKMSSTYRRMAGGVLLDAAALGVLAYGRHKAWSAAAPFILALGCRSCRGTLDQPASTAFQGRASVAGRCTGSPFDCVPDLAILRGFCYPGDHALPPDNFQEDPRPVVAHRTSPTNMGLYLLSTVTAHDLGWLGTQDTVERLGATLETMSQLDLFRGHFYNWYDTRDLHPLEPRCVSSVDSGNLADHLLVLSNGCRELIEGSSLGANLLAGVEDTLELLCEAISDIADTRRARTVTWTKLGNAVDALAASFDSPPADAADWAARFVELRGRARTVADIAHSLVEELGEAPDSGLRVWADAARACVESHARDGEMLIPWTRLNSEEVVAMTGTSSRAGARMDGD